MSAIVLALALALAAAPGPAIKGKANCYAMGDRYAACATFDASGELERIKVEPRAWLTDEHFDRDQALSTAEYLDVMTKLACAVDLGAYQPDDRPHVLAISNGLIEPVEVWTNAAVRKSVVDGEETVLSIDVIFYRRVSGIVRMKPCEPTVVEGLFEIPCRELALGPDDVTIDDNDYLVAPRDQRRFTAGERVDIHVADLRN